jgi:hypothetical protein
MNTSIWTRLLMQKSSRRSLSYSSIVFFFSFPGYSCLPIIIQASFYVAPYYSSHFFPSEVLTLWSFFFLRNLYPQWSKIFLVWADGYLITLVLDTWSSFMLSVLNFCYYNDILEAGCFIKKIILFGFIILEMDGIGGLI